MKCERDAEEKKDSDRGRNVPRYLYPVVLAFDRHDLAPSVHGNPRTVPMRETHRDPVAGRATFIVKGVRRSSA